MIVGKLIGKGATADVYNWSENSIIKIFKEHEPDELIEREIHNTIALENCSFNYPKFIQQLKWEGKRAVIYEKVTGDSMLNQIERSPLNYKKIARKLAHLHLKVHENQVEGIQEQYVYFKKRISYTRDLTDEKKEKLFKLIDMMPVGNNLCHGDFHPDNIICSEKGDYIIDWADCCIGNRCADVARTILTLRTASIPDHTPKFKRKIIQFIRNRFSKEYINEYLRLSELTKEEIIQWNVIVAAFRLCGAAGDEKSVILKIINSYFEQDSKSFES
ncbi:aminoglycoside phosphotransferase family protein [Oceanirhabdus sp. W0125-5]|uniref:aminoglycoside phosphotransferase family protein n=1 Tax=Oceanirhabdus sp. W0125-5 TaxID=2999116 RepID=UPI0022F2D619|nr:aminoglycoside phosphotransferase family protein [Oceanirhabdus sp. W0125-5]WBW94940.1 aminoglycoside phosphotransferase family protein [Oceanirhabdus sp. W0125-5]